jgi:hypothetical protein
MKMRNYEIKDFANYLLGLELVGKQSRMRTKFCKLLETQLEEVDKDRLVLAHEFADKNEDGTPKTEEKEDGSKVFVIPNQEEFNREYVELLNEEFHIVNNSDKHDMIETIKNIVLNTDQTFSGVEAVKYSRWCDILDEVNE